jgi:integrase
LGVLFARFGDPKKSTPTMALTKLQCDHAVCPPDKARIRLTDEQGLFLLVTAAGQKYWRMKYRFAGKEKGIAFGVYPEVTLAEARERREQARQALREGQDPVQLRRDRKQKQVAEVHNTFEVVARAWFEHWRGARTERHSGYVMRRLELDMFPAIGRIPIRQLTAPQIVHAVLAIQNRDAMDVAKRCWNTTGQILRYAVVYGHIERNPMEGLKPSDALKSTRKENYARLDAREMPELLRKIEGYQGTSITRLAMKLLALTFVRTGELIRARWDEFDLEAAEWRIPAAVVKMRTPHIVPLAPQAIEVLQALQTISGGKELLFPGERDHERPMSNNTILAALNRMGYGGRMTGHGFRGVASTILHEQGFPHHVIELQLAHMERKSASSAYNHATHLRERREMMNHWADHLDTLRKATPAKAPGTSVPPKGARGMKHKGS